jgi:nicotinate phosphoribosyltransferase
MFSSALLTDFYQLSMLQAYDVESISNRSTVFESFFRRLPSSRQFFVFAGLEQVLHYLENLHFSAEEISYLTSLNSFKPEFLESLKNFRFTGDVYAMPEGTIFFENEPVIQIVAPLAQAQLIESRLINFIHYQTNVASKSVRCTFAAQEKTLIDFGMRRAHGAEAALLAARAAYLAGFDGTATVEAGRLFNIPVVGTMAHSYIQAHTHESEAFLAFSRIFPENGILLIDTYNTKQAAEEITLLAKKLAAEGIKIKGVRSVMVRNILDHAGLFDVKIFVSGDLDEYRIQQLIQSKAPIDAFGIGTRLTTCADTPSLDCVYKMEVYDGKPKRKRSQNKTTWPGQKQVYRYYNTEGFMEKDEVCLHDELPPPDAKPLLSLMMQQGKRLHSSESLQKIRDRLRHQIACLSPHYKELESTRPYPVDISSSLKDLADQIDL